MKNLKCFLFVQFFLVIFYFLSAMEHPLAQQIIHAHDTNITAICTSIDKQLILTGGCDSFVKIWKFNGKEYEYIQSLQGHYFKKGTARINNLIISSDKNLIFTGSIDDNSVNIWKFNGEKYTYFQCLYHDFELAHSTIASLTVTKDLSYLIVCSNGTDICFWRFNGEKYEKSYDLQTLKAKYLKISEDNQTLILLSDKNLIIHNINLKSENINTIESVPKIFQVITECELANISGNKKIITAVPNNCHNEIHVYLQNTSGSYDLLQVLRLDWNIEFIEISVDASLIMANGKMWKFMGENYTECSQLPKSFKGTLSEDANLIVLGFYDGKVIIFRKIYK